MIKYRIVYSDKHVCEIAAYIHKNNLIWRVLRKAVSTINPDSYLEDALIEFFTEEQKNLFFLFYSDKLVKYELFIKD